MKTKLWTVTLEMTDNPGYDTKTGENLPYLLKDEIANQVARNLDAGLGLTKITVQHTGWEK